MFVQCNSFAWQHNCVVCWTHFFCYVQYLKSVFSMCTIHFCDIMPAQLLFCEILGTYFVGIGGPRLALSSCAQKTKQETCFHSQYTLCNLSGEDWAKSKLNWRIWESVWVNIFYFSHFFYHPSSQGTGVHSFSPFPLF